MLRSRAQIPIKSDEEVAAIRDACLVAATVLDELCKMVAPGVSTYEIDQRGKELMAELGAQSACYNYRVGNHVYPAHTCLSINDEVVHGIASISRVLQEGDNITVDVVVDYKGFIGDNARTVLLGEGTPQMRKLLEVTEQALYEGINEARPGKRIGDISHAVQRFVEKHGYAIVRDFVGHGVGRSMHEEPQIPNFGKKGTGAKMYPGMTLAIEPMVNMGRAAIRIDTDGWTARTVDGLPAAHFEHTVLITDDAPEILTILKK